MERTEFLFIIKEYLVPTISCCCSETFQGYWNYCSYLTQVSLLSDKHGQCVLSFTSLLFKLHAVTTVSIVQTSKEFQSDKSKAKYFKIFLSLNVFSLSLFEGHIANKCFPDSTVGKESTCNSGDPSWIPGLGRST